MPTTSVVTTAKQALVAALQASSELEGVKVAYAWPGPGAKPEQVFLGASRFVQRIANLKTGRKHRQETVQVDLIVEVWHGGRTVDKADEIEARAFEILAAVENVLADTPRFHDDIQWGEPASQGATSDAIEFEKGWAWRLVYPITVNARLT